MKRIKKDILINSILLIAVFLYYSFAIHTGYLYGFSYEELLQLLETPVCLTGIFFGITYFVFLFLLFQLAFSVYEYLSFRSWLNKNLPDLVDDSDELI